VVPTIFSIFRFVLPCRAAVGVGALAAIILAGAAGGCDRGRSEGRPLQVSYAFGEVGSNPGQFFYPRALAADPSGSDLWIIDKAGRIQRLDAQTGRPSVFFRAPEIALGRPCGITPGPSPRIRGETVQATPQDLIYVADTHYHRVLIYEPPADRPRGGGLLPEPTLIGQFGTYGTGPGEFIYLTDVAILTDESGFAVRLYICEYGGNDRISAWEPDEAGGWAFAFAFGAQGDSESPARIEFNRPQSLAVDKERGRVAVTDACNHRVGVFTLKGELILWIGSPRQGGSRPEQMAYPFGIHLLDDGSALVSEYGNHRVRHLDLETGDVLGLYGIGGRAPGHLLNPWAVTMVGRTVYVLDSGNERIQAFTLPGRRRSLAGGSVP
jgi:hypothetical protein